MTKAELRKSNLLQQKALSPDERRSASDRIAANFFNGFDFRDVRFLHVFIPIEKFNEIDTRLIVDRLWRDHPQVQVVVPRVDFEANELLNLRFGPGTELAKNRWDIEEPTHADEVDTEDIDAVLVPGLAFDRLGHRVGYGKGFYDRFLKSCSTSCAKIGLSYFEPVEIIDDSHDGDVPVNLIISPQHVTVVSK